MYLHDRCSYIRIAERVSVAAAVLFLLPACGPETGEERLRSLGLRQLTAAEVRAAHSGATARGVGADPKAYFYVFYGLDGRTKAKIGNSFDEALRSAEDAGHDEGEWRVDARGSLCVRWVHWQNGAESCMRVYRSGKKFEAYLPNGKLALSYRVEQGMPNGL